MNKLSFTFFLLTVFTVNVNAQNNRPPVAKYDATGMIELSNMVMSKTVEGCYKSDSDSDYIYEGTIVKRNFADNEITLLSIVLSDSNDERSYINIDDEQIKLMGLADHASFSSFLGKGKRVKVWVYRCGAAGRIIYADTIKLF
jgi:hypothetical protein